MGSRTDELWEQIRRLERELFLKKTQLAAAETRERGLSSFLGEGLDPAKWQEVFGKLREKIGMFSRGGNGITDVRMERDS